MTFISSVAGDRGRASNFVYGAAKAALTTYAQGLRAHLAKSGSRVLTVKLGYVDTRLAFGKVPPLLTASPEAAARRIRLHIERGTMVAYVPAFWRPVMMVLRAIPERVFICLPLP